MNLGAVRDVSPANTVLDAQNSGRVLAIDCSGLVITVVLDWVAIQNGNMTGDFGGGLYINTGGGNTTLQWQ